MKQISGFSTHEWTFHFLTFELQFQRHSLSWSPILLHLAQAQKTISSFTILLVSAGVFPQLRLLQSLH